MPTPIRITISLLLKILQYYFFPQTKSLGSTFSPLSPLQSLWFLATLSHAGYHWLLAYLGSSPPKYHALNCSPSGLLRCHLLYEASAYHSCLSELTTPLSFSHSTYRIYLDFSTIFPSPVEYKLYDMRNLCPSCLIETSYVPRASGTQYILNEHLMDERVHVADRYLIKINLVRKD